MREIQIHRTDGAAETCLVYSVNDFPFPEYPGDVYGKSGYKCKCADYCTFDIETTSIRDPVPFGYMYIWQFCLFGVMVVGRRWEEFQELLNKLESHYSLGEDREIVIYVHFLSFEYQFLKNFVFFDSVFAKEARKVMKCHTYCFDFRCSYYLTNMSLDRFLQFSPTAIYYKASGEEYDYSERRTPDSYISDDKLEYAVLDVLGLYYGLKMFFIEDTIQTIPLTSTGFVRRELRQSCKQNPKNRKLFVKTKLTTEQYIMVKEEMRGGDTNANRSSYNRSIENEHCWDIGSAYPFDIMCLYYPVTGYLERKTLSPKDFRYCIEKYCCLFRCCFVNLRAKPEEVSLYIPIAKLLKKENVYSVNGRVYKAGKAMLTLTEIDYRIISDLYDWDDMVVSKLLYAKRGKIPDEIKRPLMEYYRKKSELKGKDEYLYSKSKNKLNAIPGMMCTDPVRTQWDDTADGWTAQEPDITKALQKYYKGRNNFLPYQWSMYTMGHTRELLHIGRQRLLSSGAIPDYWDTDSLKAHGEPEEIARAEKAMETLNEKLQTLSESCGAYCDADGKRYVMGIFDKEKSYDKFRTLGAKKYCYEQDGKLKITVAGLSKTKGAAELVKKGGIEHFRPGEVFHDSGRTVSYYNDEKEARTITIDGCTFRTGSNIAIFDTTYTLDVTEEVMSAILSLGKLPEMEEAENERRSRKRNRKSAE